MNEAPENSLDVVTPEHIAAADAPVAVAEVGAGATAAIPCSSVGQCLRAAREEANLSVVEIAQALKFSTRQIEFLEADNYAALPGNTIVRGFVRSYGRLLKLNVDALLHMLDARTPNAPADVRPPDNMGVASQPGMRQLSPMVSAAIVLGLVAVLLGLWHFFGPAAKRPTAVSTNQNPVVSSSAQVPHAAESVSGNVAVLPVTATLSAADANMAEASATSVPAGNAVPALLFVFQDRSWVEVSDATKQKLQSGENSAGSRLTVSGRPPFEIVVGNATKVTLTYGERTIDLAPYTRADVARLTLD